MTTLDQLEALAKDAKDNPVAYSMRDGHTHVDMRNAITQKLFQDAANPATILALIELCKQQHEALLNCEGVFDECKDYPVTHDNVIEALAAFDRFGKE